VAKRGAEDSEVDPSHDSELSSGDEDIVQKKSYSTSVVWRWFGYLKSDVEQIKPTCKVCRRMVPSKTGNTTNLFNHLKKYHPSDYTESVKMRAESGQLVSLSQSRLSTSAAASSGPAGTGGAAAQPKQQSIISSFSAVAPYEQNSKRSKSITKALSFCIAEDMMPLNTVEKEGFKYLIKVLDQRYEIPGRKYFSQTALPQLYDERREKLEMELKDVSFFATTADLWSSRSSEPYLSLTIHYMDKEWTLQSTCLQTAYFPEDHTAEIISRGLEDALESWNLSKDRQVCITTDNGANIVKAVALQGWTRLQCFGHRLHSAIGGSMKDKRIERAVGVSKKLVSAFSYSWKKKKALAAAQDELKLPKHKLITESPTRWRVASCNDCKNSGAGEGHCKGFVR
ncbi:zinc finger BED domain-containing protein 1-like, partial [Nothobranchius furzeri]